jgi:hypothetical protein
MKNAIVISLLVIITAACSLVTAEVRSSDFELAIPVELTFTALIPEGSDMSQGLVLTLLDLLTGENINPKHYVMEAEGERSYRLTISVPRDSLIAYLYERGELALVREASASGGAIQYRSYFVDGPGHIVADVIANWEDQGIEAQSGSIRGTIVDADDGKTLANIVVSASGHHSQSDQNGNFEINGLVQGLHTIVARSENGEYKSFQQGALVAAGLETPASIAINKNESVDVNFIVSVSEDHVPGVPIIMLGNLGSGSEFVAEGRDAEGRYLFSARLPVDSDIRYKYSLGDAFWNAEHLINGDYLVRQLVLSPDSNGLIIRDHIAAWTAGPSAPIWFEMQSPGEKEAFIQLKFTDWTPAIQMWPLGNGTFAYKLNSPTNFAEPLEYRYCLDTFCLHVEASDEQRSVIGNMEIVQYVEDEVQTWK